MPAGLVAVFGLIFSAANPLVQSFADGVWDWLAWVTWYPSHARVTFWCLTALFGVLEWRVRTERTSDSRALLIFPLLCALGGAMLLTHSHAVTNVKDQLLIEISHVVLALAVIAAAWSRWIQVRLDGTASRLAGWIWPLAFVAAGASLLLYREQ